MKLKQFKLTLLLIIMSSSLVAKVPLGVQLNWHNSDTSCIKLSDTISSTCTNVYIESEYGVINGDSMSIRHKIDNSGSGAPGSRALIVELIDVNSNVVKTYTYNYSPGSNNTWLDWKFHMNYSGTYKIRINFKFSGTNQIQISGIDVPVTILLPIKDKSIYDNQLDSALNHKRVDRIYPNPTESVVYVYVSYSVKLRLIDTNGKVLLITTLNQVDLSPFKTGIYYLQILSQDNTVIATEKLYKL